MAVCKFFLSGNCRFGDKCRNEHPGASQQSQGGGLFGRVTRDNEQMPGTFGRKPENQTNNAFSRQNQHQSQSGYTRQPENQNVFARQPQYQGRGGYSNNDRNYSNNDRNYSSNDRNSNRNQNHGDSRSFGVTADLLHTDLAQERPQWLMSAYGPGKDPPVQLFGGHPLEQSFEEVRAEHYLAISQGNPQAGIENERKLAALSNTQVESVLKNKQAAVRYIENGGRNHPNRVDICRARSDFVKSVDVAFLAHQWSSRPAAFGIDFKFDTLASTAFAQPPQAPNTIPGVFGTQNQPAPAWGTQNTAFPSAPHHGQTASITMGDQPSLFGVQNPAQTNTFAAQPAFAQPQTTQPSAFAAPSAFAQPQPQPPAFVAPFGQQQPQQGEFLQPTPPSNENIATPFATQSTPAQPALAPPNANSTGAATPDLSTYATFNNDQLATWKGKAVTIIEGVPCYRRPDGGWERIWFPQGAPQPPTASDVPAEMYIDGVKQEYGFAAQNGNFRGQVPEMPPKEDWVRWDI